MKSMDPSFSREAFEKELREYIVPEVVDAYLSADKEALREWCVRPVIFSHNHLLKKLGFEYRPTMFCGPRWNSTYARAL